MTKEADAELWKHRRDRKYAPVMGVEYEEISLAVQDFEIDFYM